MSLESWKAEYLAVDVEDCSEEDALKHSLIKWSGLQEASLAEHKVRRSTIFLIEDGPDECLRIDGTTCALCYHYFMTEDMHRENCAKCPLISCDLEWGSFIEGDPMPMYNKIKALIYK